AATRGVGRRSAVRLKGETGGRGYGWFRFRRERRRGRRARLFGDRAVLVVTRGLPGFGATVAELGHQPDPGGQDADRRESRGGLGTAVTAVVDGVGGR